MKVEFRLDRVQNYWLIKIRIVGRMWKEMFAMPST